MYLVFCSCDLVVILSSYIFRKESIFNLGSAETKLLYTLHWVLLDAMDECSLEEKERGNTDYTDYNIPLASITVDTIYISFSFQYSH